MRDMFYVSQILSDGTYIAVTAPGRDLASTAFEHLRALIVSTQPEVHGVAPPELKCVGRL